MRPGSLFSIVYVRTYTDRCVIYLLTRKYVDVIIVSQFFNRFKKVGVNVYDLFLSVTLATCHDSTAGLYRNLEQFFRS